MEIINEIREHFASAQNGARKLTTLPSKFPALSIRNDKVYGVAIVFNSDIDVSEKFSNCKLYTKNFCIENKTNKYLILSSDIDSLRYEFATICSQFVEPGINGNDRINLINNPFDWWEKWKNLLGNTSSEKKAYSVIAEMLVLSEILKKDSNVEWTAIKLGNHDIESNMGSYEVKSTLNRYESKITISNQYQLESNKALTLYFCRLEESIEGISINDVKNELIKNGYNKDKIEYQLSQIGYEKGSSIRNKKYKILEKRKYEVDSTFPKITRVSFKEDKIPDSIIRINYTIDLDGIRYTTW